MMKLQKIQHHGQIITVQHLYIIRIILVQVQIQKMQKWPFSFQAPFFVFSAVSPCVPVNSLDFPAQHEGEDKLADGQGKDSGYQAGFVTEG